jgi:hypothetical protein
MIKTVSLSLVLFFIFCFNPFPISAQETSGSDEPTTDKTDSKSEDSLYRLKRGMKEYLFEPGVAPWKPSHFAGPEEFDTSHRKMAFANFRMGRVIGTKGNVSYSYLFGFMPLTIAFRNEIPNPAYRSEQTTPGVERTIRTTTYGVGITPANFRFLFRANKRVKPFAQAGAGIVMYNHPMPIPETRRFNLTGDFGGGVMIHSSPDRAWTIGYRYFHISNGNLTEKVYNVGYNANSIYLGYWFFK